MTDRPTALERAQVCRQRAGRAKGTTRHHLIMAAQGWDRVASLLAEVDRVEAAAEVAERDAERARVDTDNG